MNETILNLALATLPSNLLTDLFFQELCNTIPLESKLCDKIGISLSMYEIFQKMNKRSINYFKPLHKEEDQMSLIANFQNQLFMLSIKQKNDTFMITYKITNANYLKELIFTKHTSYSKVKIITQTKINGYITSYQNEVHYYSPAYKEQKSSLSIKESLADFSELFGIPQNFALYFYQNFAKYQRGLNRSKLMKELELDNLTRPTKDLYHFTAPIYLLNLIEEIIKYNYNNLQLKTRANHIISLLAKEIDIKEKIIMSKNILESILKYIVGLSLDILLTNGLIICKKEREYEQNEITMNEQNIQIKKERLRVSEAQELFYRNENNEDKEALKEFFGITKTR